jgi:hypothetical protein
MVALEKLNLAMVPVVAEAAGVPLVLMVDQEVVLDKITLMVEVAVKVEIRNM